jgi:hypothetical protein
MNNNRYPNKEYDWQDTKIYEAKISAITNNVAVEDVAEIKATGKKAFRKDNHTWIPAKHAGALKRLKIGDKIQFKAQQYSYMNLARKWNKGLGNLEII